jgi:hypothetical protein
MIKYNNKGYKNEQICKKKENGTKNLDRIQVK